MLQPLVDDRLLAVDVHEPLERFFSQEGQNDRPPHEYGIKQLRRHVSHQARAKPCATSPHSTNPRSTRSRTGRSGPCCCEALGVHPQKLLEVLLDEA